MAITINELTLPWTAHEAKDYIQSQTDNFGVFFDMDRCIELRSIMQLETVEITRKLKRLACDPTLDVDKSDSMIAALENMGVSKKYFTNLYTKKLEFTTDTRKAVIENAGTSEDVKELLTLYNQYKSNKRNIGYLRNLTFLPLCVATSKEGHRMVRACPTWSVLSTSRLSASNPGVQGVPRIMPDIICEPAGYTLVRCDSGQIEPRLNFSYFLRDELIMNLIKYYNDAYFGIMHYCIMKDGELKACKEDFESNFKPVEITDEVKALRQDIKRLTNAGSYGSSNLGNIVPELATAYNNRIVNHPARLSLENKVKEYVRRGGKTFYGAFGTAVTPDSTETYNVGDSNWENHLIRCGINNPVQTTASELMLHSVYNAKEILSRAKDSHIAFYKHDEACFYVSDEDMANGIGDELADITAYNVLDWIPIEADPLIGVKAGDYPKYII